MKRCIFKGQDASCTTMHQGAWCIFAKNEGAHCTFCTSCTTPFNLWIIILRVNHSLLPFTSHTRFRATNLRISCQKQRMEENIDTRDKNTGQATQKFWLVPYRTASRTGHGTRDIQKSRAVPTPEILRLFNDEVCSIPVDIWISENNFSPP